jgi:hypothetical protein
VGLVIFIQEVNKRGSFCTLEKTVYPESFYVYLLFLVYFKKYKLYRKLLFGIAAPLFCCRVGGACSRVMRVRSDRTWNGYLPSSDQGLVAYKKRLEEEEVNACHVLYR